MPALLIKHIRTRTILGHLISVVKDTFSAAIIKIPGVDQTVSQEQIPFPILSTKRNTMKFTEENSVCVYH